jgi:AcrR family transcriptional regulator
VGEQREDASAISEGRSRNKRGEGAKLGEMILAAAQSLLEESGDESAVTIRAIARRARIAPQSFYLQFESLDALLFALYRQAFEGLHAALLDAHLSRSDPTGRLQAISEAYVEFALQNPGSYRALMSSRGAVHPGWNPDELPGARTFALLREGIAALQEQGDNSTSLHLATTLLWTQLHGIAILMIDRPTFPWPDSRELIRTALMSPR